jgi:hypothetical protein
MLPNGPLPDSGVTPLSVSAAAEVPARAAMLFFLIQGLVGPVLIGILSAADAVELLDHQLDRIFVA